VTLPAESPAVVILDVMNLRGSEGKRDDALFSIRDFDGYVSALTSVLPHAVIVGIVDGTSVNGDDDRNWQSQFETLNDLHELRRRTKLHKDNPMYLCLLPPKTQETQRQSLYKKIAKRPTEYKPDLQYIAADPVEVHLVEKFAPNSALITYDLLAKPEDFNFFPANHELRSNIFEPNWLSSSGRYEFRQKGRVTRRRPSRRKKTTPGADAPLIEDFLPSVPPSEQEVIDLRLRAYGYVHDVVNEHRAAGNRTVPIVLKWQRPKSPFDVLDSRKFPKKVPEPTVPLEELDQIDNAQIRNLEDSGVITRVETEDVDLVRSIEELRPFMGKRVRVHAMLRVDGDGVTLIWIGTESRVQVVVKEATSSLKSGLVRVEGVLSDEGGNLVLSVAAAKDVRRESLSDVVVRRLGRLVKKDFDGHSVGEWSFPALPRRKAPRTSAPAVLVDGGKDDSGSEPGGRSSRHPANSGSTGATLAAIGEETALGAFDDSSNRVTADGRGENGRTSQVDEPPTTGPAPERLRYKNRWIGAAIAVTITLAIALASYALTDVFGFKTPKPAACVDLGQQACDALVSEWRADAIRIFIYGVRDADGVVR